MSALAISAIGLVWFALGYKFYGTFIERKLVNPDNERETPAVALDDNIDFSPARPAFLWGHHFASIAGAGPIIGPILAVAYFGWGPPLLWIALGSVFMGAVHDYLSLMLSVRNRGEGIAEITGIAVSRRSRLVFAILLWLTLIFIVTVFAVSGAKALISEPSLVIPTFGVCMIAIVLGLAVYRFKAPVVLASALAIVAAYALVWVGYRYPLSLPDSWGLHAELIWVITMLFFYCGLASLLPVWLLLQPRDFISSVKLFVGLGLGLLGILFSSHAFQAPMLRGGAMVDGRPVWPLLFITVACGAISGFHTMVSTGTTSKQLAREGQGKAIAFGGMIMEGVLAFMVVMLVSTGLHWGAAPAGLSPAEGMAWFQTALQGSWIVAFGSAFGRIVSGLGIPGLGLGLASLLGMVMVKTFVMTSLDTSTRLGRFVFAETIARHVPLLRNRLVATLILLLPAYLLAVTNTYGNIWKMFGAANQMIAAVALIAISAYLAGRGRPTPYTVLPGLFMAITTLAALGWNTLNPATGYLVAASRNWTLGMLSLLLIVLALVVCADGLAALRGYQTRRRSPLT